MFNHHLGWIACFDGRQKTILELGVGTWSMQDILIIQPCTLLNVNNNGTTMHASLIHLWTCTDTDHTVESSHRIGRISTRVVQHHTTAMTLASTPAHAALADPASQGDPDDARDVGKDMNDPRRIPLPTSPKSLPPRLPSRKPSGWISTLPQSTKSTKSASSIRSTSIQSTHSVHSVNSIQSAKSHDKDSSRASSNTLVDPIDVANVNQQTTDTRHVSGMNGVQGREGRRRRTSRRISGVPLVVGGRRVSGVMQYAIQPPSPSPTASPSSPSLSGCGSGEDVEDVHTSSEGFDQDHHTNNQRNVGEIDNVTDDEGEKEEERVQGGLEGLLVRAAEGDGDWMEVDEQVEDLDDNDNELESGLPGQDMDEVWMSHIRHQLGTLFPDFFNEETHQPPSQDGCFHESDENPGKNEDGGDEGTWVAHQQGLARFARGGLGGMGGLGGGIGGVPNVRSEISGLRDEIERLRGVVGGLAEGLGQRASFDRHEQGQGDAQGETNRLPIEHHHLQYPQSEPDAMVNESSNAVEQGAGREAGLHNLPPEFITASIALNPFTAALNCTDDPDMIRLPDNHTISSDFSMGQSYLAPKLPHHPTHQCPVPRRETCRLYWRSRVENGRKAKGKSRANDWWE